MTQYVLRLCMPKLSETSREPHLDDLQERTHPRTWSDESDPGPSIGSMRSTESIHQPTGSEGLKELSNERASTRKLRGQDLNLRPSGYEPDELPGCSTPRQWVPPYAPHGKASISLEPSRRRLTCRTSRRERAERHENDPSLSQKTQNGSRPDSFTCFITKNERVCRIPGSPISFSPWSLLKSAMSRTRIFNR